MTSAACWWDDWKLFLYVASPNERVFLVDFLLRSTCVLCYEVTECSQTGGSLVKLLEPVCVWIGGHCVAPSLHLAAACTPITSPAIAALGQLTHSPFSPLSDCLPLSHTCCFSCQPPPPHCLIRQIRYTDWNTAKLAKYTVKCLLEKSSVCICCDLNTPFYIAISEVGLGLKALWSFFF